MFDGLIDQVRGRLAAVGRAPLGPGVRAVIDRVRAEHLSYLEAEALEDLAREARSCERDGLEGAIVEMGCALGGSAIVLASAKDPGRPLAVYDVFGMIPPPSGRDGSDVHDRYREINAGRAEGLGGAAYYGYEGDLHAKVIASFQALGFDPQDHNVRLIKGLYEATLRVNGPVALAHIDCDWYESVKLCLERIEPHLVRGGTLVIDDYDHWSGCKAAVDDYFAAGRRSGYRFVRRSRLHIIKR